jgi:hypothetical protein
MFIITFKSFFFRKRGLLSHDLTVIKERTKSQIIVSSIALKDPYLQATSLIHL